MLTTNRRADLAAMEIIAQASENMMRADRCAPSTTEYRSLAAAWRYCLNRSRNLPQPEKL